MNLSRIDVQIHQENLIQSLVKFVAEIDNNYNKSWQSSTKFEVKERYYLTADEDIKLIFNCTPPLFGALTLRETKHSTFWGREIFTYFLILHLYKGMSESQITLELNRMQFELLHSSFHSIRKQIIHYEAEQDYKLKSDIINSLKIFNRA